MRYNRVTIGFALSPGFPVAAASICGVAAGHVWAQRRHGADCCAGARGYRWAVNETR
jgi:hypothetical protein